MALPALIGAAVVGGLAQAATSLVGRVVLALGITYVSYSGLSTLFGTLQSQISGQLGGLGGTLNGWLGVLQVQTSISILMSAFATRVTLAGLNGVIKKAILK